jgi:hypothetical protein
MASNLKEKLALLLKDTERLGDSERLNRLTRLVDEEIDNLKTEHQLTFNDLAYIRSRAVDIYNRANMSSFNVEGHSHRSEPENLRTFSFVEATIDFLRGNGLTKITVKVKEKA